MKEINIVTLLRNFGPKKLASNQMSAEVFWHCPHFGLAHIGSQPIPNAEFTIARDFQKSWSIPPTPRSSVPLLFLFIISLHYSISIPPMSEPDPSDDRPSAAGHHLSRPSGPRSLNLDAPSFAPSPGSSPSRSLGGCPDGPSLSIPSEPEEAQRGGSRRRGGRRCGAGDGAGGRRCGADAPAAGGARRDGAGSGRREARAPPRVAAAESASPGGAAGGVGGEVCFILFNKFFYRPNFTQIFFFF